MSTSATPLRWGVLGAARIAERALIPAIRAAGGQIVAVGCRDAARGRAYADRLGIPEVTDYEGLMRHEGIDAIYIALHNGAHLPWTLEAAAQGKHVLCEKPIGLTVHEVEQMIAAQWVHKRVIMEAFMYRFHPQITRARELIRGGALGELRLMRGAFSFMLDDPHDVRWDARFGGGAMYDVGCYPLNLMRHVTSSEPQIAAASAEYSESGVDHALAAQLRFGHVRGQLDCAFSLPFQQYFEAIGTEGRLFLDQPFLSFKGETRIQLGDSEERIPGCDPYEIMVEHFHKVVAGEEALLYSLEGSLGQARAIDAILAAAKREHLS